MSGLSALRRLLGRESPPGIRVHVLLKGRTGSGWHDADREITLPVGATLRMLFDAAERQGIRLREVIESSPHLGHTLMLNGERCPVDVNLERPLADGDEVFLLAPLAGG
ncbi:MAG TPA: MoaD/ThiS family protein [Candidatus Kryptonia bacterium]|nr:MoaD/ThiS family protein [Candidatus Kryptonia bacterium]